LSIPSVPEDLESSRSRTGRKLFRSHRATGLLLHPAREIKVHLNHDCYF
jgi:hypothetical protein